MKRAQIPQIEPSLGAFTPCAARQRVATLQRMPQVVSRYRPVFKVLAGVVVAAFASIGIASPAVAAPGSRASAYFTDSFDFGLSKWMQTGPLSSFTSVPGYTGAAAAITVDGTTGGPNSSSEMAALWLDGSNRWGSNGMDVWYRTRILFPSSYVPTVGEWNWVYEWHNDDTSASYAGAYSPTVGIDTWSGQELLKVRWMGGPTTAPVSNVAVGPAIQRDHWYDFVFHVVWSPNPSTGYVQWYLDGQKLMDRHMPTLYQRPDGSLGQNWFGLYNYRIHADWSSSIHFDDVKIGPTRKSVG